MHEYFAKLGFEPEIAEIYLALYKHGPQSLLGLAKNAKVERTRLYRLLDTLAENQLIEVEVEYKRKLYKAAPISNLRIVLSKREQTTAELQQELVRLESDFQATSLSSPLTHVQFYQGVDGIKQILWNQLKTRTDIRSILHENMQTRTKLTFFERWVERCNAQNIRSRSLVGEHFLRTQQEWYSTHVNEKLKNWEGRRLPHATLPITHSMIIYDNVVSYLNWKDGEVFGIEMYNQQIATTHRRIFDMLWAQGIPVSGHGEGGTES